jgi:biotin carboxylase
MHHILLLGAGQEQCIAILEAQALGYKVIACDANPDAPGLQIADHGMVCDIRDVDTLVEIGKKHAVRGIFCHAVEIPETVALVAQALGLPGLVPEVARKCTDKSTRIDALTKAGIRVAGFESVSSVAQLDRAGQRFGFPLVLKPVDNAGSRGVRMVQSAAELPSAYEEAMKYSRETEVLVERVLRGPQVSTESVVFDGKVITFAFADRNYESEQFYHPYFIENGINFPTCLPETQVQAILALVERTIAALDITYGAAKGDIIIHEETPHVIEMACRTSGGWFGAGSIPKATGINALKPLLQMSMGDAPDLDALKPKYTLGCAQRYWIPKQRGVFHGASGLDRVAQMEGVQMFNAFFPPPGTPMEKATHHAQRYAQVICTAQTRERAIALAAGAIDAIEVEMTLS